MDGRPDRGGRPPSDRLALSTALARAGLGDNGTLRGIPFTYALDALAKRWHVPPWVLEDAPLEWLLRGLEFERLEASTVTKTRTFHDG